MGYSLYQKEKAKIEIMFKTMNVQTLDYQKGLFKPLSTNYGRRNIENKLALPKHHPFVE